jgi:uncharacterized membrane protein YeaQ/YmgE (transglycosylase-associated protein family)
LGHYAHRYTAGIVVGVLFGVLARLEMLRTDYRQYPTYPHGRIIHIALGVIAAALGAVAVPSLLDKEYTAVTFLSLAAQQFRDVRKMERETLSKLDDLELVPRGAAYIEGMALVFEGRNYLVILTAFISSMFAVLFAWYWGCVAGLLTMLLSQFLKSGKTLDYITDIHEAAVKLDGPDLFVDDIYIMNVGLQDSREKIAKHGMGFVLTPKDRNGRVSLANLGQRQAILHDLSTILGIFRDSGEPSLIPMAKLDLNDGRLAVFLLPQVSDTRLALTMLKKVPLLENSVRMPSEA